jgi:hypothetical protein
MILIGRGLQHKVTNTGTEQMRLRWLITPPALGGLVSRNRASAPHG